MTINPHLTNYTLSILPAMALAVHSLNGLIWPAFNTGPLLICSALPALGLLLYATIRALIRRQPGVDLLAALSIVGAIVMREPATAAVVALMMATGRLLDSYAAGKAKREMTGLLNRVPRMSHRQVNGELQPVAVDDIQTGDLLVIKQGDTVPVDGRLLDAHATLDESSLTGESVLVDKTAGALIYSGVVNQGNVFLMRATRKAQDSTLQGIVKMVDGASQARSPVTRLADRYALWFIPATLLLAGLAAWWHHDPVLALAVLVVATPCPLLLAVPVALVSGLSLCARYGVLVKGGAALESLAKVNTLFFDKTGTLTGGNASLVSVRQLQSVYSADDILRGAAAVDQMSCHVIASAILQAAHARGLGALPLPEQVEEVPGVGVAGRVEGKYICLGNLDFVLQHASPGPWLVNEKKQLTQEGGSRVYVAIDGVMAGVLELSDQLRVETPRALRRLRKAGVATMTMLTGDKQDVAESIGTGIGVDYVYAELTPAEKLAHISQASQHHKTMMIGDGVNDAPALAAASVGVAMGVRGAAAAVESADIVLMTDRLDRLADAKNIAIRTISIARQSVWVGMGLCAAAMLFAAMGLLPPLEGAILQELIDLAAIITALRALSPLVLRTGAVMLSTEKVQALRDEHVVLAAVLTETSSLARRLPGLPVAERGTALQALFYQLTTQLLPHEQQDEQHLYPSVLPMLPGDDPLGALSRSHQEIFKEMRRLGQLIAIYNGEQEETTLQDIQRTLYGLDAIIRLHFAQEDEVFSGLQEN